MNSDLGLVLEAAERRARELLSQAANYEGLGQTQVAKETHDEHYQPLRRAIDNVRQVLMTPSTAGGRSGKAPREYRPATREEIDAIVTRHEPHDYGRDRTPHPPLARDRGQ